MTVSRALRSVHRLSGIVAAVFLITLAATGIGLNHAHAWGLDTLQLRSRPLARLYNLGADLTVYPLGDRHVLAVGPDRWWLDGEVFPAPLDEVVGAIRNGTDVYVAGPGTLLILDRRGHLVDRLGPAILPDRTIRRLGLRGRQIELATGHGLYASVDGLAWAAAVDGKDIAWSERSGAPPPGNAAARLLPGVTAERVLLDLHSGRLLGVTGPFVADLSAAAMMFLALSGAWLYLRPRIPGRGR